MGETINSLKKNKQKKTIDTIEPPENKYFARPDILNKVWTHLELLFLVFHTRDIAIYLWGEGSHNRNGVHKDKMWIFSPKIVFFRFFI